jgi:hypothetical protein
MKQINFPRPTGYEVIKINNGEFFTLGQILNVKNKVKSIIENAQEVVNENIINNSNLINFVILYEYNRYSDIMQPTNLLDFFSHIINLYNSIQKYDKNILTIKQFDNLDSCYFKNIHKFFSETNLKPLCGCLICTDKFIKNDSVIVLPCKHNFHKNCIKKWLTEESNTCPLCKKTIS